MSNKEKRKELKSRIKKKRQKKYQKRVKTDERLKAKKQKTEAKQNKKAEKLKRKEAKKKSGPVWNHEQKKFLLKQLIRRDFKSRYKRAALGVLWSMLSPLCFFAAQAVVFSKILGRGEHYIAYLITGNIVFHYFSDATTNSMFALQANGGIISKIKVDKDMFLFSRSVSCLINFFFTAAVMFFIIASGDPEVDRAPYSFPLEFPFADISCDMPFFHEYGHRIYTFCLVRIIQGYPVSVQHIHTNTDILLSNILLHGQIPGTTSECILL